MRGYNFVLFKTSPIGYNEIIPTYGSLSLALPALIGSGGIRIREEHTCW